MIMLYQEIDVVFKYEVGIDATLAHRHGAPQNGYIWRSELGASNCQYQLRFGVWIWGGRRSLSHMALRMDQ